MKNEKLHSLFSRSVMAGLFMGLIATTVSLLYNIIYRETSGFDLSSIINVSSIIFSVPIVLLLAGVFYNALSKYKSGAVIYTVVFILLTLICVYLDFQFQRSVDPLIATEFRRLLLGIIVISGLSSFFIPYLASHETNII